MAIAHNLGFPRIGKNRELKFALEKFWKGESGREDLLALAAELRERHWRQQGELDYLPVGDFSLYDQVLDMSFTLGHIPERVRDLPGDDDLDAYFRIARGRSAGDEKGVAAGEMTKWFDTNYHYIVPEFSADTTFTLNPARLLAQLSEAKQSSAAPKPVIIGPLTYLWLGKTKDGCDKLSLLESLLPAYAQLLDRLAEDGVQWVQIDEPILVTELDSTWQQAFRDAYNHLNASLPDLLLTTYFGRLEDNLSLVCELPVQGLHLDALNAREELPAVLEQLPAGRVLSLGVVDGRNIWKTDLQTALQWLTPVHARLGDRLWLAPSCSLQHVPVDLDSETALDAEIKSWLAFAVQKLNEVCILATALNHGRAAVAEALEANARDITGRRQSSRVRNAKVRESIAGLTPAMSQRQSPFPQRITLQREQLNLPRFPTTTIGSFPQTRAIRQVRLAYRQGILDVNSYQAEIKKEIERCIRAQEELGLDLLVHGEAERNDMVEYFGEQLEGYAFSQSGWVQSYGSRCVKPPILFGDIRRPKAMTLHWLRYAQSLTEKPVKGMLTGPVTLLNWSFVRDDQPRRDTCRQLALAVREEVLDLESEGLQVIQIDEAALREGLPLRRSNWQDYLGWAVECFRIAANGVRDATQIHTHMCYSEFNDIIEAIAEMDADVITIETSRSDLELLSAFDRFEYPNEIGPGVYDIHSPNIPGQDEILALMNKTLEKVPAERLWVNPDCGLKTRSWEDVMPALKNMVAAAKTLRAMDN